MADMSGNEGEPAHWVFGYGSLIWNPGFAYVVARPAMLAGAHRALCIYSHRHRGTVERPGLVFGLVPGGSCRGMAFGVTEADWPAVRQYLREREQDSGVYRDVRRSVQIGGCDRVSALTFIVDLDHPQYAGRLKPETQLDMVRRAIGVSGPNSDYVRNTVSHLEAMGIRDRHLRDLSLRLDEPALS